MSGTRKLVQSARAASLSVSASDPASSRASTPVAEEKPLSATQMLFRPRSRYLWDRAGHVKSTRGSSYLIKLIRCVIGPLQFSF
jgi:hypothetical protein